MLLVIIHLQQLLAGVAEISLLLEERGKTLSQHFLRDLGNAVAHELHATPSLCDWAYKVCEREHFQARVCERMRSVLELLTDWLRRSDLIFDSRG